ncbi:MAG TPA: ParB N-terminal domain-containing protein [Rubrobacteraceae bacterium]|nr:ParB N-terminal domain-containing protein [Rubrobacteraceae bacterium]
MISSLDNLRLVESGRLILHEAHDEERLERLRARVEAEREQRNPVIVSSHGDNYLVLDGAHRVRVLRELGYLLVLVQLVEPPGRAESWGHLLRGVDPEALRAVAEIDPCDEPCENPLAVTEFGGGGKVYVRSREEGLPGEVQALWGLQSLYPRGVTVRRVDPEGPFDPARGEALIRYRPFTPAELVEVVRSGAVLPAGITRFRVSERVLGVRYPLEKMENGNLSARNAELEDFVRGRWEEHRIRYYGEPVVLFE